MANGESEFAKFQREIHEAVKFYKELIDEKGDASSAPCTLTRLEGQEVTDFSSQYGSEHSFSYVASNLAGKTSVFPTYGDFINACVFRTYGPWWSIAPSAVKRYKRTPADFISVDFIEICFSECLYPKCIEVYETYNSGSIVRILACAGNDLPNGKIKWVTLWEGPPSPVRKPHIFSPPLRNIDFATRSIRLELNHDNQDYYTELDGIRLIGTKTKSTESCDSLNKFQPSANKTEMKTELIDLEKELVQTFDKLSTDCDTSHDDKCYFTFMPEEIIQLILNYLDTRDLCRLAQTCRLLRDHCYDPLLFTDLNLQPYWTQVVNSTFPSITSRCKSLRRLNLSWCGKGSFIITKHIEDFLKSCSNTLETLELSSCQFMTPKLLSNIFSVCSNLSEINLQSCVWITDFSAFRNFSLKNLTRLNLYRTKIDEESLVTLFRSSSNLEHLNIGSCSKLHNSINNVLLELGHNCRNLKSVDLWRMKAVDHNGLSHLYNNCPLLEEIDVGWCTALKSDTKCFLNFASKCPNLKKVYLTANRTINDRDVLAFATSCTLLEQLDILGTREVSKTTIIRLLEKCKHMKMLDLSFCMCINFDDVISLQSLFPHVCIKKSFQNISET